MAGILTTKLYIPPRRTNAVSRPRLVAWLNQGMDGKLSLIAAPAGFGKTTLVTEWLAQLPDDRQQVAWISLDEGDGEPVRFITYLVAAVRTVLPDFGADVRGALAAPQNPNLEAITHDILNEWAQGVHPMILVLDDYHLVDDQATHQVVNDFIAHAPPRLHFVITSRDIPPLSLPLWRARGQLTEIQAADLRFSTTETQHFLNHTMGLALKDPAITTIETQTEGWVAGLQLAAISLRGTQNVDIFLDSFTGRDRRVADYLLTEVLEHQTPETQQFLLQTSILTRFNASLCAAVLAKEEQQPQMQRFLADLEATDLFIVPLDNERYWYRYHHLFAQLLRQRLRNIHSEAEIAGLHRRAAKWYQDRLMFDQAVDQAMRARDYAYAAKLIPQIPLEMLWDHNIGSLIQRWAKELPAEAIQNAPEAAIWIMHAHLLRGDDETAQYYLHLIREFPAVEAQRNIFESILVRNDGDIDRALSLAQSAAASLPVEEAPLKLMASIQVVNCQLWLGKLAQAAATLADIKNWMPPDRHVALHTQLELSDTRGRIAKFMGDYTQAERILNESLALVEQTDGKIPQVGYTYFHLGSIYYQWNDLDRSKMYFTKAAELGERTGITDITLNAMLGLAELACLRQEQEKILAVVEKLRRLAQQTNLSAIRAVISALEADFALCLGDLSAAVRWAKASGFTLEDRPDFSRIGEYLIFADICLAESRAFGEKSELAMLVDFLERLIQQAQSCAHIFYAIRGLVYKALALDLNGRDKDAVQTLQLALKMAQPGSIMRVFLDLGAPMQQLLEKALSYGEQLPYIRRLLVVFAEEAGTDGDGQVQPVSSVSLPEPLTGREFEVLQLIAAGLSNKQIEEKLVISNNTVRSHIKNLYSKLGVSNRTQAVLHARETGLL